MKRKSIDLRHLEYIYKKYLEYKTKKLKMTPILLRLLPVEPISLDTTDEEDNSDATSPSVNLVGTTTPEQNDLTLDSPADIE